MSAKLATRIANKLYLFRNREMVDQSRERKLPAIKNFHKTIKNSIKQLQKKDLNYIIEEQRTFTFN